MARGNPEETLHKAVVVWLRVQYPKLLFFHVPNQNSGPVQWRVKMKQLGAQAGVPDLVLIFDDGRVGFIELKAGRGKLSVAQNAFSVAAKWRGALWAECKSLEQVQRIMRIWTGKA